MAADDQHSITVHIQNLKPGADAGKTLAELRVSEYFFDRLVAVIARHFRLHGRVGPEDVANSVLRIAFDGMERGEYVQFDCRENLWALLTTIAVRKALNRVRDESRRRRNGGAGPLVEDVADPRPDPARTAEVQEQCRRLFAVLGDDALRQIARWKVEDDLSNREIARRLGRAEETVRRQVLLIRSLWKREINDG